MTVMVNFIAYKTGLYFQAEKPLPPTRAKGRPYAQMVHSRSHHSAMLNRVKVVIVIESVGSVEMRCITNLSFVLLHRIVVDRFVRSMFHLSGSRRSSRGFCAIYVRHFKIPVSLNLNVRIHDRSGFARAGNHAQCHIVWWIEIPRFDKLRLTVW